MTDDKLIEAVARAIAHVDEQNGAGCWEYYQATSPKHIEYLKEQAEAALRAVREGQWPEMETLLLNSFRYCLGRRSYAVGGCVETLTKYWPMIRADYRNKICEEIVEAINRGEAGMEMDVEQWRSILVLPTPPKE